MDSLGTGEVARTGSDPAASGRGYFARGTAPFTCDPLVMPLRDGTPVLVRAVEPEDKIRLQDGLSRMSTCSIYRRFARTVSRLTADELRYLTEVDQQNHIAWGAVDPSDPHESGLGISRLIRDPHCPTRAEVAIAVVDEYQQLGLGTILLAAMVAQAQTRSIATLRAIVLPDNHVVLAWLSRLGARYTGDGAQTTLDLILGDPFPVNRTARRFQDVLDQVESVWTRNRRYTGVRW